MPEEEKLEFLKREEIQTMAKDLAKLREVEAQKERERIAALKIKEEITPPLLEKEEKIPEKPSPAASGTMAGKKEETPVALIPKPLKKASSFQKVLVRITLVLILFLIAGFFYWYFAIKSKFPSEEILPPEGEVTPGEKITIPLSLIFISSIVFLILSKEVVKTM